MKNKILLFVLFITITLQAQKKYVIVPHKFSFSMRKNQYNLNKTTKQFFEKEGFEVFYDDELPLKLTKGKCLAYQVSMIKKSRARSHSIWIDVKDCNDNLVVKSEEGKSKLLEVTRSYNQALEKALQSLRGKLIIDDANSQSKPSLLVDTLKNKRVVKNESIVYQIEKSTRNSLMLVSKLGNAKISCLETNLSDVYIAKRAEITGVFLKKEGAWFFEYEQNNKLQSEQILLE